MLPLLQEGAQAFTLHSLITEKMQDGRFLEPVYIIIMYGEIAFRMQPKQARHEPLFIRMAEVKDIVFEEN